MLVYLRVTGILSPYEKGVIWDPICFTGCLDPPGQRYDSIGDLDSKGWWYNTMHLFVVLFDCQLWEPYRPMVAPTLRKSNWIISTGRGWKYKVLKPPPIYNWYTSKSSNIHHGSLNFYPEPLRKQSFSNPWFAALFWAHQDYYMFSKGFI